MRTQEEIVKRIEERSSGDIFGYEVDQYYLYLDYDHAMVHREIEATEKEWNDATPELTREHVLSRMKDYMSFAWGKANGCRGLSADRSIRHYIAWIWLIGDTALLQLVQEEYRDRYCSYGKPILEKICKYYEWDSREYDNKAIVGGQS